MSIPLSSSCGWCMALRDHDGPDCPWHNNEPPNDLLERRSGSVSKLHEEAKKLLDEDEARWHEQLMKKFGPSGRLRRHDRPAFQNLLPPHESSPDYGDDVDGTLPTYAKADVDFSLKALGARYVDALSNWEGDAVDALRYAIIGIDPGYPTGMAIYHTTTSPTSVTAKGINIVNPDKSVTINYKGKGRNFMERIDVLKSQLRQLQEEMAILERFPKDNFDDGTIISFERVFRRRWEDVKDNPNVVKHHYAAIKTNGYWYVTGRHNEAPQGGTWGQLTEWMGEFVGSMYLMMPVRDLLNRQPVLDSGVEISTAPPVETAEASTDADVTSPVVPVGVSLVELPDDERDSDVPPGEPEHTHNKWQ